MEGCVSVSRKLITTNERIGVVVLLRDPNSRADGKHGNALIIVHYLHLCSTSQGMLVAAFSLHCSWASLYRCNGYLGAVCLTERLLGTDLHASPDACWAVHSRDIVCVDFACKSRCLCWHQLPRTVIVAVLYYSRSLS